MKIEHSLLALNWLTKYGEYPDGYDSSDETAATAIATALKTNAINATTAQDVKEKPALTRHYKAEPVAGGRTEGRDALSRELRQRRKTVLSSFVCQQVPPFSKEEVKVEPTPRRFCTTKPLPVSVKCEQGWHADTCGSPLDFPGLLYCGHPPGSNRWTSMRGEELRAMWD